MGNCLTLAIWKSYKVYLGSFVMRFTQVGDIHPPDGVIAQTAPAPIRNAANPVGVFFRLGPGGWEAGSPESLPFPPT
jgi:hypothetical protein